MSVIHRAVATAAATAVVVGAGLAMMAPASASASPAPFIGPFSHLKNIASTALTILRDGWVVVGSTGSPPGSGALFGLAVAPHGSGVYYVDDATNFLRLLH